MDKSLICSLKLIFMQPVAKGSFRMQPGGNFSNVEKSAIFRLIWPSKKVNDKPVWKVLIYWAILVVLYRFATAYFINSWNGRKCHWKSTVRHALGKFAICPPLGFCIVLVRKSSERVDMEMKQRKFRRIGRMVTFCPLAVSNSTFWQTWETILRTQRLKFRDVFVTPWEE